MTLLNSTLKAPVSNIDFLAFLDNFFKRLQRLTIQLQRIEVKSSPTQHRSTREEGQKKIQQVEGCATGAFHEMMMYMASMLLILYGFGATLFLRVTPSMFSSQVALDNGS